MALKPRLWFAACLVAALGACGLAIEGWRWTQIQHYNQAVAAGEFASAASHANDYGLFAEAYAKHQKGQLQQARVLYAKAARARNHALGQAARFNIANTYLQQASSVDIDKDPDLVLPLVELAKVSYREVLALDSHHWDAKYNLERALQLSPDVGNERVTEIQGRRGTVRTVISADPEGALP